MGNSTMTTPVTRLNLGHYSLRFEDPSDYDAGLIHEIFNNSYDAITGAHKASETTLRNLRVTAHVFGYHLFATEGLWVAVRKVLAPKGVNKAYQIFPDGANKLHVVSITCELNGIGPTTFLSARYADGRAEVYEPVPITSMAEMLEVEDNLIFYSGPQVNISDETDVYYEADDPFFAMNLREEVTPAFAAFDLEDRVEATYLHGRNQFESYIGAEHFPIEAGFEVKLAPTH